LREREGQRKRGNGIKKDRERGVQREVSRDKGQRERERERERKRKREVRLFRIAERTAR